MSDNNVEEIRMKVEEFVTFLSSKRVGQNHDYTHTDVGRQNGKYYIESGIEHRTFLELYTATFRHNDYALSEKQKEIGPLMTDFDFKFDAKYMERQYALDDIKKVVKILNKIIYNTLDIEKSNIIAYVTEKKLPSIKYEDANKEKKQTQYKETSDDESDKSDSENEQSTENIISGQNIKEIKDGFHVCYIIPMTKDQRLYVYHQLAETAEKEDIFENIPYSNTYEKILDESTICVNNWMMYGSRKQVQTSLGQHYILTHIFKYNMVEEPIDNYTNEELVSLFSIRQFDEDDQLNLREEVKDDFVKFKQRALKKKTKKTSKELSDQTNSTQPKLSYTVLLAKKLVAILDPKKRSYEYKDWFYLCCTLKSIGDELYDDFIAISEKAPNFDKDACNRLWHDKNVYSYTIASLYHWAREDNEEKMLEILKTTCNNVIQRAEEGSDMSIAEVLYALYPFNFKCSSIKDAQWYEFKNHRWNTIEKAYAIQPIIGNVITGLLYEQSNKYYMLQRGGKGEENDAMAKKQMSLNKVIRKLRDVAKINSIITACARLYYDKDFESKLDSYTNLVGFNNGVYDLDTGIFRDGTPDDLISITTGYNYIEFTGTEPAFTEIDDYFNKIQTNENIRNYLLRTIAGYINGVCRDQEFLFWTGSGCHSADTEILMFDGSIKLAKDVCISDQLMGDDSTPRNVRNLFRGTQDMYNIQLCDGTTYCVNANHRLALKCIFENKVTFDDVSKTYIVEYHKKTTDGPVKMTKYFRSDDSTQLINAQLAERYLEKKNIKQSTINFGTIIPIMVSDYVKLDESIKQYYVCYRNPVYYEHQNIMMDAYKLGSSLSYGNIPTAYLYNSIDIRRKMLSGIIDTFGNSTTDMQQSHRLLQININNVTLMHDVIFLCRSLGHHVEILNETSIRVSGNLKTLTCKNIDIKTIDDTAHTLTYSFEVVNIGKGNFYGFSVDKNERYILQNCVVTYNSNGKSLTTKLIKKTFGKYYSTLEHTVLTQKRAGSSQATPELADKRGVRFIIMQEPEETDKINSSFLKQMSGEDDLNVRALYKECFSYTPQFKLIMVCNVLPTITAIDGGTWRRIIVVPFDSEFVENPTKANQFPLDKNMGKKMKEWYQPFMWLLLHKYYPKWVNGSKPPEEVRCKTDEYKRAMDMYRDFISENYVLTGVDDDAVSIVNLYGAFKPWFRENMEGSKCPSKRLLIENLDKSMNIKTKNGSFTKLKLKAVDDINDE